MDDNIIKWIEEWYYSQCDGEWEHEYGIKIFTVDNPGWYITIDLKYTELENFEIDKSSMEGSETNWYFYQVKDGIYKASGDPNKLGFLLDKFRELVGSI